MDDVAVGQEVLFRRFMNALNDELNDKHAQEDRRHLEEQGEIESTAMGRPDPRQYRRSQNADDCSGEYMRDASKLDQEQCRFHAFATDHEQRKQEDADKRSDARTGVSV